MDYSLIKNSEEVGLSARCCYDDIDNQEYDIKEEEFDEINDEEFNEINHEGLDKEKINQIEQMMEMNVAILKLYVDRDDEDLCILYKEHIEKHNTSMSNEFPDSGFDLFIPDEVVFDKAFENKIINMKIKAEMIYHGETSAYYIHPRSSISKTPLMVSNHTGVADQGYRGWLMGAFRWLSLNNSQDTKSYVIEKNTRLLQICHPSLCPIVVILMFFESDLTNTERNAGGFGSTGIVGSVCSHGTEEHACDDTSSFSSMNPEVGTNIA